MHKLFKGFAICLIIVFSCLFIEKTSANEAYFVWEKTVIDVPVYAKLDEYKDDYVVKLYVNGVASTEFEVEYEVNTSTFSTVSTNHVGKYTVYYKAYSKKYYLSSTVGIVFNVVDITPPKVMLKENILELEIGNEITDFSWMTATDDTCSSSQLSVKIDDSNVIYEAPGNYKCYLLVEDLYQNVTKKDFYIKIIDKTKPSLTVIKPLVFSYKENVDIKEFIECKDNSNIDISNLIEVSFIDTSSLGKVLFTVKVKDYSGNMIEVLLEGVVIDDAAPVLTLQTDEIVLDIQDYYLFDENYFKQFVLELKDNYSIDLDLSVDVSNITQTVEDFIITFTVIDENKNKTQKQLLVKLRETIGPQIICDDVIYLKKNQEVNLMDLVSVYDEFDSKALERLMVEYDDFTTINEGVYQVKYVCFNTSGIYTEKNVTIIVGNPKSTSKINPFIKTVLIVSGGLVSTIVGLSVYKRIKNKRKY